MWKCLRVKGKSTCKNAQGQTHMLHHNSVQSHIRLYELYVNITLTSYVGFQYWNDHSEENIQDLCTCCLLQPDTVWVNRGHSTTVLSNISSLTYFSQVLIQLPPDTNQGLTFPSCCNHAQGMASICTVGEILFCCQVRNVLERCPSIVPLTGDKHGKCRAQGQRLRVCSVLSLMSYLPCL